MREILLENVNFYGANWNSILSIPDDMVFVEINRYKGKDGIDKQRFYSGFYPFDKNLYKSITERQSRINAYNILDTWLYVEIYNAYPVNEDLPLISMEEFNKQYLPWFKKYIIEYVGPKRVTYNWHEKLISALQTGELITDAIFTEDPYYTIAMDKILQFTGHDEHLQINVAEVTFKSWINEDDDYNKMEIYTRKFSTILTDDLIIKGKYIFQDSEEAKNKFNNRIKELINYFE